MRPVQEQIETFKRMLQGRKFERDSVVLKACIDWLKLAAHELTAEQSRDMEALVRSSFGISAEEYVRMFTDYVPSINGTQAATKIEQSLARIIPPKSFLARYAEYTLHSEAPLAFHIFSALVGVGVMLGRKIWFDMGYYRLFPPLSVIILGPSGVKKTSATNIVVNMIQAMEITKIYSEKITPEALVAAMEDFTQGLIYAPELSVFLGNQDYNSGLVPLLTRFLDCPDVWESGTIMRGRHILTNIAISCLMCSTPDWFVSNTPKDIFEGGFIARNILVVQDVSPRIEPVPNPGRRGARETLMAELAHINALQGQMEMTPECWKRYVDWYTEQKQRHLTPEFELLTTYYQRKPDHVKRIAMCIHAIDHQNLELCVECFNTALALLDWVEQFLPPVLRKMFKTLSGAEQELVLRVVKNAGGVIRHAALIRKLQYRMHAAQVRSIIMSLKEAGQIEELLDANTHIYKIKEGGDD